MCPLLKHLAIPWDNLIFEVSLPLIDVTYCIVSVPDVSHYFSKSEVNYKTDFFIFTALCTISFLLNEVRTKWNKQWEILIFSPHFQLLLNRNNPKQERCWKQTDTMNSISYFTFIRDKVRITTNYIYFRC